MHFFAEDSYVNGPIVNLFEGRAEGFGSAGFSVDEPDLFFGAGHGFKIIDQLRVCGLGVYRGAPKIFTVGSRWRIFQPRVFCAE
jgi:hypothetical protein